ncbi:MAG: hypothetical protein JWO80_680 [Bryobacterales bacterium]|nr:hypothetical protein [Bryobacterales bacterium]
MSKFGVRALLSALFFIPTAITWGQANTGEITGTVSDQTGAALPSATVKLLNTETKAERTVSTNEAGLYDLPALSPGKYTLSASAPGFRTEDRTGIELQVGQVARLDFAMQVGSVSDTIEVKGGAPVLETENASVGTVIENKRIVDLPLNGRNPLQLVSLTPGATTNGPASSQGQQRMGGARNAFSLNVSGQRTSVNHYALDGVENTDPNFNTYLFLPSVDALQEFKVESGTYTAEFGRGLSQINMTTRSGTNEFHGALFEFLRNSALDAKNFFDPAGPIAPFKRNQFGGTSGGPIYIPKVFNGKNKLFYFFDYEGLRERKAQTALFNMPPAKPRGGDFSGDPAIIYDPATRVVDASGKLISQSPFPNNIIPQNRLSSTATKALANWFPLPNQGVPGSYTNNFVDNEGRRNDNDQYTIRGDYNMSAKSQFYGRFSHTSDSGYLPLTTPGLGYNNQVTSWQGLIAHTLVLGADKVNEFKFAVARLAGANQQPSANKTNWVQQLGIGGVPTNISQYWGVPVFQFGGGAISTVGECSDCPFVNYDTIFQWTDNFSWNRGRHNFRFGTDDRRVRYNQIGAVVARGRFTFNGTYTADPSISSPPASNSLADFLLADIATSEGQSGAPIAAFRGYSLNFYAMDSWKVTPKLTVNFGLRYELEPPFRDKYDHIVNIAFNWANTMLPEYVRAGTGDFYAGNPPPPFQLPSNIPYTRNGMFGNRAYQTSYKDWAPRLGITWSVDNKTVIRAGGGIYYIREIGNAQFDLVRNAPYSTRRNENAQSTIIPSLNFTVPFVQTAAPSFILVNQYNQNTPYVPQWSFGVQRQVTSSSALEVTYIGSAGVHLQRLMTYNTATPGPPTGINNRRPWFPIYGGSFQVMNDPSHSSYDSLQIRFQQRFTKGLTVLSSYSWSKSIDNGSGIRTVDGDSLTPSNDYNLQLDRGLSAFDFRHRWTTSFLYELPIGHGKAVLGDSNRFVDSLLGGWQLGGIATLQSGFPFTLYCGSGPVQNGGDNCYPDNLGGNPTLDSNLRGPNRWFKTENFVNRINDPSLPQYRYGNNARNNVIGPPLVDVDFSTMKTFRFSERRGLEFRAEFFNLLNHPIFNQPGTTVGTSNFGVITGTRVDSREIQFALKLNY